MEIKIYNNPNPRSPPSKDQNLRFGELFTNHMLVMEYDEDKGGWGEAEIRPYGELGLEAGAAVLHYGQSVWEGLKCYIHNGRLRLFRPRENFNRMKIKT